MEAKIESVSDTAYWVAHFRAIESERPDALFHDPLARVLVGDHGRKIAESMSAEKIMTWIMAVRTHAIDRLILQALDLGVDTVLNLGAGLDTRPYRMKLPKELRWIEADYPRVVDYKNSKLQNEKPVCRLKRVGIDLADEGARHAFFEKTAAESKSVLILTEGVIPYLTAEAVSKLARDMISQKQFHFWIQDFHFGGRRRVPRSWRKKLAASPFRFEVKDWFGFFSELGWVAKEKILTFEEGQRVKRRLPFMFPVSFFFLFMSQKARKRIREMSGYVLLERVR